MTWLLRDLFFLPQLSPSSRAIPWRRRRGTRKHCNDFRPQVESLEDRTVLTACTPGVPGLGLPYLTAPALHPSTDSGLTDNITNPDFTSNQLMFHGSALAATPGSLVRVYFNNACIGSAVAGDDGSYGGITMSAEGLAEGVYSFTATQEVDNLGESAHSNPLQVTIDKTRPTVSMFSPAPDPTNQREIPVFLEFSEPVLSFEREDIQATNAIVGDPQGGNVFTLTAIDEGLVTADIAVGLDCPTPADYGPRQGFCDTAGNGSEAAPQFRRTFDSLRPTGTIAINSGASHTNALTVTLNLTCDGTGTACAYMAFFDDNGNHSDFEPFAATKSYTLPEGDGLKTVYVRFRDQAGNENTPEDVISDTITLDTIAPTVLEVRAGAAPSPYKRAGELIQIFVTFSESVFVSGTPQLALETGRPGAVAEYAAGSGASSLRFDYVVQPGDNSADLEYVSTTALSGVVQDAASNSADLTLPAPGEPGSLSANGQIIVDTTPPSSNMFFPEDGGVYRQSNWGSCEEAPAGPPYYVCGFSGTATDGGPAGIDTEEMSIRQNSTGLYWDGSAFAAASETFVVAENLVVDGTFNWWLSFAIESFPADGSYTATARGIDQAGNVEAGTAATFTIDRRPAVLEVIGGYGPEVPAPTGGERGLITIFVTFSEPVFVTGTPELALETGRTGAVAYYAARSGTSSLIFEYRVQPGDNSPDLDYISTTALSGIIRGAAGNNANLTLPAPGAEGSLGENSQIVIDTTPPSSTILFPTQGGVYGDSNWGSNCGEAYLGPYFICAIADGGPSGMKTEQFSIQQNSSGLYWDGQSFTASSETFVFAQHFTGDGTSDVWIYPAVYSSTDGSYTLKARGIDNAHNEEAGTMVTFTIDRMPPSVTLTADRAPDRNGWYNHAVTFTVSATDSSAVTCDDPIIYSGPDNSAAMVTGGCTDAAGNMSSATATFMYDASAPDNATEIRSTSHTPGLASNDNTIDIEWTAATDAISGVDGYGFVFAATSVPTCTSVKVIEETATAATSPALSDGTYYFRLCTVDNAGNWTPAAVIGDFIIDTTGPSVISVTSSNSDALPYKPGQIITIQVVFDEPVFVASGTPTLTLETGDADAVARYVGGAGAATLEFQYTVVLGHFNPDLNYLSTAALVGDIEDALGNRAVLHLPDLESPFSLKEQKNLNVAALPDYVTDNDESGYREKGRWVNVSDPAALNGLYRVATQCGQNCGKRTDYTFTAAPGTYQLYATWVPGLDRAIDALYSVLIGGNSTPVFTTTLNQQLAPGDGAYGGVMWERIGGDVTLTLTAPTTVTIRVTGSTTGKVVADGILLIDPPPEDGTIVVGEGEEMGRGSNRDLVAALLDRADVRSQWTDQRKRDLPEEMSPTYQVAVRKLQKALAGELLTERGQALAIKAADTLFASGISDDGDEWALLDARSILHT